MKKQITILLIALISFFFAAGVQAETTYKPFIMASQGTGTVEAKVAEVKTALTANGFEVVGEYSPYPTAIIVIVTNDMLKKNAAASGDVDDDEFGGFGAAQRVAVTDANGEIQVSYTNPLYMHFVYRLKNLDVMKQVKDQLSKALGMEKEYGANEGLEADDLEDYSYTAMHANFDDPDELSKYSNFSAAVQAVEAALAANKGGVSKVYRIDIPGTEQVLFGVAMTKKVSSDAKIMKEIDFKTMKSTAHLPYEMLVVGNKVFALNASFRIAISFPELSMMGDNSFMNIMDSPDDIEEALTLASGGSN